MLETKRKRRRELSAIYVAAACLLVAVTRLGVVAAATVENREAYPRLYVQSQVPFREEEEKTVYFTFDDGPSHNTEALLDLLQEQQVPATFFVSGQKAEEEYSALLLQRIVEDGHALGLHTYTHDYGDIYRSVDAFLADIDRIRAYIWETTGVHPEILRFPGGSATRSADPAVMQEIIREVTRRGYVYYDWNVVSGDDTKEVLPPQMLADNILSQAQGKESVVVLCHDGPNPTSTPEAVEIAIGAFREQGYRFDKLTPEQKPLQLNKLKD